MSIRNTTKNWGILAKAFHWLSVVMLVSVWLMVAWHEAVDKESAAYVQSIMLHKALGVSLGALVLARLLWRSSNVTPTPLPAPVWQKNISGWVHAGLYLCMLAMPLSGVIMSQFAGKPVSWFGVFDLPQMLTVNRELAGDIKELHEDVFWPLLVLLTLVHVGAAVFHQVFMRDNVLKRMW